MNKFVKFQSKRLLFREWTTEDAQFLYELNSDSEVIRYTGDPPFESVQHALEFIQDYKHYKEFGYGRWLAVLKSTGEPIGWAGLKNQMKEENFIDLGFRFKRTYWNQGFGTEAAKACLSFGFEYLNMTEITGRAAVKNVNSIKILQKIGMREFNNAKKCHGLEARYFMISCKVFLSQK